MIADAWRANAQSLSNPIARLTTAVFGLVPVWLPLIVLRLTLARPFFASGLTRWAALGLLCMAAVIQLTYPDAWPDYHLPWATMALAIMTFGPGAISIDRLLGLDGWSKARKAE